MTIDWDLQHGAEYVRTELHKRFGGRRQGGIGPSRKTPHVLIFTDPARGEPHGYYDGWKDDGLFYYTGEGQRGDQAMKGGNRSIRDHAAEGRALRLFEGAAGTVKYLGRFEYVADYETDAPETGGGPLRKVIVFALRPLDTTPGQPARRSKLPEAPTDGPPRIRNVPIEAANTERAVVEPKRDPYEAERREAELVRNFCDEARKHGRNPERLRITPTHEARPIFCDILLHDPDHLIEAKGSITREALRMAIGQLIDYGRFTLSGTPTAVLVPERPRADLEALLQTAGTTPVWPEAGTYSTPSGPFFPA